MNSAKRPRAASGHTPARSKQYTERQGQFLAYIHQYIILNGCAPSEADIQRFFRVTPPTVHSMVLTLERRGFIRRVPGQARSISAIVPPEALPRLQHPQDRAKNLKVGEKLRTSLGLDDELALNANASVIFPRWNVSDQI